MRYILRKNYGRNFLGQKYTKSWKIIDTKNGNVVETGNRDNLGYGNQRVRDLNNTQSDVSEREDKFQTTIDELRGNVEAKSQQERDILELKSTRQQGALQRQLKNAVLARGGDPSQMQSILPQIAHQSDKAVGDISRDIVKNELSALENIGKMELSTDMSLEEIALKEQELDILKAQTQATLDSQPSAFESFLPMLATGVGTYFGSPAGGAMAGNFLQSILGNFQQGLSNPSQPYTAYGQGDWG
jgi:hypothetical protein